MSKYIIWSDAHFHDYTAYSENGSRLQLCKEAIYKMVEYAKENNINYLMFAGDLFHAKIKLPATVVNAIVEVFKELTAIHPEMIIYFITGNHCHIKNNIYGEEIKHSLSFLEEQFEFFKCVDNETISIGDDVWHGIPFYRYREHLYQSIEDTVNRFKGPRNFALLHNHPDGQLNKYIPTEFIYEETLLFMFDFIFCGHSHQHQQVQDNLVIVGSPIANSHLDENVSKKGFLVFDSDELTYELIDLKFPKFVTVDEINESSEDYQRQKEKVLLTENIFDPSMSLEDMFINYWGEHSEDLELLEAGLSLIK